MYIAVKNVKTAVHLKHRFPSLVVNYPPALCLPTVAEDDAQKEKIIICFSR